LASRELYASTDNGINWEKINGIPKSSDVRSAQFNSKGWLYVLTRYDGIFYTKDLKNWQAINNGILNKSDPTDFMVKDDMMMVGYPFDGIYISTDNGGFWQKVIVSGDSQYFKLFNRHADGTLYIFDDNWKVYRSQDIGKSWRPLKLDLGFDLTMPQGFAICNDGNLYIGSNESIISQVSPLTLKGASQRYFDLNSSARSVSNISAYKDDILYLVRFAPKSGVYSKNNNWGRLELGFSKDIYAYYAKTDGNFLLVGEEGLFYKN